MLYRTRLQGRQSQSAKPTRVSKTLRNPHPLVNQTERVLSKREPDKYGVSRLRKKKYSTRKPSVLRKSRSIETDFTPICG